MGDCIIELFDTVKYRDIFSVKSQHDTLSHFAFVNCTVIEDCKVIRDKLREIKSCTEGSAVGFESVSVGESVCANTALQKLRQIMLQHVATSVNSDLKQTMLDLLNVALGSKWQHFNILLCKEGFQSR
jgi:hypothetical protein